MCMCLEAFVATSWNVSCIRTGNEHNLCLLPHQKREREKKKLSQRTWAGSTSALANTFLSGFFGLKLFLHLFFVLTSEPVPSPPPHHPLPPTSVPPTRFVSTPGTLLSGVISKAWERFHPTERRVVFARLTRCFIKPWGSAMVWIEKQTSNVRRRRKKNRADNKWADASALLV